MKKLSTALILTGTLLFNSIFFGCATIHQQKETRAKEIVRNLKDYEGTFFMWARYDDAYQYMAGRLKSDYPCKFENLDIYETTKFLKEDVNNHKTLTREGDYIDIPFYKNCPKDFNLFD